MKQPKPDYRMNRGILTAIGAIGIAQGLKILTHKKVTGKWEVKKQFQLEVCQVPIRQAFQHLLHT